MSRDLLHKFEFLNAGLVFHYECTTLKSGFRRDHMI